MKKLSMVLAFYYLLVGMTILVAPKQFYLNTPGLSQMGPYNAHFIIDVSLAFIVSSLALSWGVFRQIKTTAIAGAAWPFMHALFHLKIWVHRNFILDYISLTDFTAVIIPGVLVLYLAFKVKENAL